MVFGFGELRAFFTCGGIRQSDIKPIAGTQQLHAFARDVNVLSGEPRGTTSMPCQSASTRDIFVCRGRGPNHPPCLGVCAQVFISSPIVFSMVELLLLYVLSRSKSCGSVGNRCRLQNSSSKIDEITAGSCNAAHSSIYMIRMSDEKHNQTHNKTKSILVVFSL